MNFTRTHVSIDDWVINFYESPTYYKLIVALTPSLWLRFLGRDSIATKRLDDRLWLMMDRGVLPVAVTNAALANCCVEFGNLIIWTCHGPRLDMAIHGESRRMQLASRHVALRLRRYLRTHLKAVVLYQNGPNFTT